MTDRDKMPFGKHEGKAIANVPPSYLKWLWDNHIVTIRTWNRVYNYIKDNLDVIEKEISQS